GFSQSRYHVLFGLGRDLFLRQNIAVLTVLRLQSDDVLAAESGDGPRHVGLTGGALTHFLSKFGGERRVRGLCHQLERGSDLAIGEYIEERRLAESNT